MQPLQIQVKADDDTSDWVITDKSGNKVTGTEVFWTATHHNGDVDKPRYRTMFYYITDVPLDAHSNFSSYKPMGQLNCSSAPNRPEDSAGNQEYKYSISRTTFLQQAVAAGVTGDMLFRAGDAGVTVYLNPVYQRYTADSTSAPIYGIDQFLNYTWSSDTDSLIDATYNQTFTLTAANIYNLKVILVQEGSSGHGDYINIDNVYPVDNNNKLNKSVLVHNVVIPNLPNEPGKLIAFEDYSYPLPSSYLILGKDDTRYKFDHQDYAFEQRASGTIPAHQSGQTNIPSSTFNPQNGCPDATPGSTLTVYMVYKTPPYTYTIDAVDENHNKLRDLNSVETTTHVDETVTSDYGTDKMKTFQKGTGNNIVNYSYSNQWYLTYKDQGSNMQTITGNQAAVVQKMPGALEGSNAVFHLIYSTGPPTPPPTQPPSPSPAISPEIPPPPDSSTMPFTTVQSTGILRADVRGSERFIATQGVPTTESLFGQVNTTKYLLGYDLEKKVGIKDFTVKVTRNYILKYYDASPAHKPVTETVPVTLPISVPRAYGYWEIVNLECYGINNAEIRNYALSGGSTIIYSSVYSPPSVSYIHSDNETDHLIPPADITLPDVTLTPAPGDDTKRPVIPNCTDEFTYIALSQAGKAKVKSDFLSYNGTTVMSNAIVDYNAPDINKTVMQQCYSVTDDNVLYKPNNIIDATKDNGTFYTSGTVTYSAIAKVGSYKSDYLNYPISGLNQVVIHTPVVCIPTITANNSKYVQLIYPHSSCVQLVLDPDPTLSDFTVNISNTGFHTGKQGYFTRDFSKSIRDPNVSYIASDHGLLMNQVKFPFDVYIDAGKANDCSDDNFIKAETWITIDRSTPRFYLPMTDNEGVYTVNFRTVAVNGLNYLARTEKTANTQLTNYVATDSINVEISGRIYGLNIYDITDYPMWQDAFRIPNSTDLKKDDPGYPDGTPFATYSSGRSYTYTTGTNDQYGNDTGRNIKYTFPLVNGSHPQYKNQGILKPGYAFRFSLATTGNLFSEACMVDIKPNFYYVDKDGKNRQAVDLYYTESINNKTCSLVKAGSAQDQINIKDVRTGDLYLGIPESEMKQTAPLMGMTYSKFIWNYSPMFNFSDIRLNWGFRTFTNNGYLNKIKSYQSYSDVLAKGLSDGDVLERMQRWYGQYYLPNEVHAVAKGYDVMDYLDKHGIDYSEDFWLDDGYIIVNFTIETVGEDGNRRLSYINYPNYRDNGNCSMWLTENPPMSKTSNKGPTFNFYAGDIMIYYAGKRMTDDYDTGAIY